MAGDSLDPVKPGVLVFIGGCNKSLEALDDIYFLHTGLDVWTITLLLSLFDSVLLTVICSAFK